MTDEPRQPDRPPPPDFAAHGAAYERDRSSQGSHGDQSLPAARADLLISPQLYLGATVYVVKDPVSLAYFRLQPAEHYVFKQLDGRATASEIAQRVNRRFPAQETRADDVMAFVGTLANSGLLLGRNETHGRWLRGEAIKRRRGRLFGAVMNFLFMKIPIFDPDELLTKLYRSLRVVMNRGGLIVALLFMLASTIAALSQIHRVAALFFPVLSWENLLLLSATFFVVKTIHEFGHGLAAKARGLEVHELGVLMMIVFPMFYVDVTDAWMVPRRRDRLWINAGGVFIEFIFASIAAWVWVATDPGVVNQIAFNTMLAASVTTLLFNANPLMRYDGYYFLMDWLEIPNLRTKASQYVGYLAQRYLLGMRDVQPPVEARRKPIFMSLYAAASGGYRWLVTLGVVVLLYHILDPYGLESIGTLLGLFAVVTMVLYPLVMGLQFIWKQQARIGRRIVTSIGGLAALAAVAAAILSVSTEQTVEHAAVVLAHQRQPLYVPEDGRVVGVAAEPERLLRQGETILQLADPKLVEKLESTKVDRELAQAELDSGRQKKRSDLVAAAASKIEQYTAQIDYYQDRVDRLTVVAPFDGRLLATDRLRSLLGTRVKQGRDLGTFVGAGDRSIVVILPQDDASAVVQGMPARVRLWGDSGAIHNGQVRRVGKQFLRALPHESLSSQYSGEVDSVMGEGYKSAPGTPSVAAEIVLDDEATRDPGRAVDLDGLTGRGKIVIGHASLASQQWRRVRQALSLDWWL
jgi:putative peptide zinc metalloprotease protein